MLSTAKKSVDQVTTAIVGCGDVGLRIARGLGMNERLLAVVASNQSRQTLTDLGLSVWQCSFDDQVEPTPAKSFPYAEKLYYLVPPQPSGVVDQRSVHFLELLAEQDQEEGARSRRIVLISTTGVYGDYDGEWVTEQTTTSPGTDRGRRRLDMEHQWLDYAQAKGHVLSILRVPGIYSFSRLPAARLQRGEPIVDPKECGFTNRIHADDLAMICQRVMHDQRSTSIYNASDGVPGSISEYLLAAAQVLNLPAPPLISMAEASKKLSAGMVSYLRESRRIDNHKLLQNFNLQLQYPDYRKGMHFCSLQDIKRLQDNSTSE